MAYYRLYSLDLCDHHIMDVSDFSADSDPAAMLQVMPDRLGVSRELWIACGRDGAAYRTRTCDPRITKARFVLEVSYMLQLLRLARFG